MPLTDNQFDVVLRSFGLGAFSTLDFSQRTEETFPDAWNSIVEQYGVGGQGAGQHYTAYSYIAQFLLRRSNDNGKLDKLDYRRAPEGYGSGIIRFWAVNRDQLGGVRYPDEMPDDPSFPEGAKTTVTVNRYERNRDARQKCIEHHGVKCSACNFDFEGTYGPLGAGFIHVHHLKPLSSIGNNYEVDPVEDLRPVCPNCHAMIHLEATPLSIEELKELLEAQRSKK